MANCRPLMSVCPSTRSCWRASTGVGNYGGLWRAGFRGQADHFAVRQVIIRGVLSINQELTVNPMIAESWSVSDDASEYTFNLREG